MSDDRRPVLVGTCRKCGGWVMVLALAFSDKRDQRDFMKSAVGYNVREMPKADLLEIPACEHVMGAKKQAVQQETLALEFPA